MVICLFLFFCFCMQKTAYEMRISDWSSDVCSSDLHSSTNCDRSEPYIAVATTFAPSRSKAVAMALPRLRSAPVTNATFPSKLDETIAGLLSKCLFAIQAGQGLSSRESRPGPGRD